MYLFQVTFETHNITYRVLPGLWNIVASLCCAGHTVQNVSISCASMCIADETWCRQQTTVNEELSESGRRRKRKRKRERAEGEREMPIAVAHT